MELSARRRSLLEAAESEAQRLGQERPRAADLARVIAMEGPGAELLKVVFSPAVYDAVGGEPAAVPGFDARAFLTQCTSDEPSAILRELSPYLMGAAGAELTAPAAAEAPAERPEDVAAEWSLGDVVLARYRVLDLLGSGAMGVVHRVRHLQWGVDLAVKSPRPGFFTTERSKQAFVREAELWVGLGQHPNLCTCHYVRRLGGIPRVFAEFAEGGSLAARLGDPGFYSHDDSEPLGRVLDIAIGFARGLAYAHGRGLVHQDVRPGNVLLGADQAAMVADFGLARATAAARPDVSLTGFTREYASPEQALGAERPGFARITSATDVWSFAVSVLEVFAGAPPRHGALAADLLSRFHDEGGRGRVGTMPARLATLLVACLADDPSARPPMAAVAAELERIYEAVAAGAYPRAPTATGPRGIAGELSNRALSMLDLGRPENADRLLLEALAQDPHHPEATYNQGLREWRNGLIVDTELIRRLEDLAQSHAQDAIDEQLLAWVHMERGDPHAAVEALDRATALTGETDEIIDARKAAAAGIDSARHLRHLPGFAASAYTVDVAVSRDARFALAGLHDGRAVFWDLASSRIQHVLQGHRDEVRVGMTPDARRAVTVARGEALACVWDLEAGKLVATLEGHAGPVVCAAVSADGRTTVTGGEDGTLRHWDADTRRCLGTFTTGARGPYSIALSADGRFAFAGCRDGALQVWDLKRTELAWTLHEHEHSILALALTPDTRYVVTGGFDGTVRHWDLCAPDRAITLNGHDGPVTATAITADGRLALSSGLDATLRLWDLRARRCRRTLEPARGIPFFTFALAVDREVALVAHAYGSADLWHVAPGAGHRSQYAYARPRPSALAAAIDRHVAQAVAEGRALLEAGSVAPAVMVLRRARSIPGYARDPALRELWRTAGSHGRRGRLLAQWQGASGVTGGPVLSIGLTHDTRRALVAIAGGTLTLVDVERQELLVRLTASDKLLTAGMSSDGAHALSGNSDGTASLWDLRSGECTRTFTADVGGVAAVALSPDAQVALTGGGDGLLRFFDVAGNRFWGYSGHTAPIAAVALTPDCRFAMSGGEDAKACVWDVTTATCLHMLEGHDGTVAAVALADDARFALTGGPDDRPRVWDLTTGSCLRTLDCRTPVHDLTLSPDGLHAVTAGGGPNVQLWAVATGDCLQELEGHTEDVTAVALASDAGAVVSGSQDGSLRVWQLEWDYEFSS